jgi:hypothetical protein
MKSFNQTYEEIVEAKKRKPKKSIKNRKKNTSTSGMGGIKRYKKLIADFIGPGFNPLVLSNGKDKAWVWTIRDKPEGEPGANAVEVVLRLMEDDAIIMSVIPHEGTSTSFANQVLKDFGKLLGMHYGFEPDMKKLNKNGDFNVVH